VFAIKGKKVGGGEDINTKKGDGNTAQGRKNVVKNDKNGESESGRKSV